jgi:hypothetical protein
MWIRDFASREIATDGEGASPTLSFTVKKNEIIVAVSAISGAISAGTPAWQADGESAQSMSGASAFGVDTSLGAGATVHVLFSPSVGDGLITWAIIGSTDYRGVLAVYAIQAAGSSQDDTDSDNDLGGTDGRASVTAEAAVELAIHTFAQAEDASGVVEITDYDGVQDDGSDNDGDYQPTTVGHKLMESTGADTVGPTRDVASGSPTYDGGQAAVLLAAGASVEYPGESNTNRLVDFATAFAQVAEYAAGSLSGGSDGSMEVGQVEGTSDLFGWYWQSDTFNVSAGGSVLVLVAWQGEYVGPIGPSGAHIRVGDVPTVSGANLVGSIRSGESQDDVIIQAALASYEASATGHRVWVEHMTGDVVFSDPPDEENPIDVNSPPDQALWVKVYIFDDTFVGTDSLRYCLLDAERGPWYEDDPQQEIGFYAPLSVDDADSNTMSVTLFAGNGMASGGAFESGIGLADTVELRDSFFSGSFGCFHGQGAAVAAQEYEWGGSFTKEVVNGAGLAFVLVGADYEEGGGDDPPPPQDDPSPRWMRNRYRQIGDQSRRSSGLLARGH